MGKKGFSRAVVVLACCGSLVTVSCGDQSQPGSQSGSSAGTQSGRNGGAPAPGSTGTPGRNLPYPATTTTTVTTTATPVRIAEEDLTNYQLFQATEVQLYVLFGVDVQSAINAEQSLQTLLSIAADAKAVFSTVGAVIGAINAIVTIGRFLGFLSPAVDEVAETNSNVLETAASAGMAALQTNVDGDYSLAKSALEIVNENGPLDDADNDSLNAMNNLTAGRDWTREIDGSGDDAFTDGKGMFAPVSTDGRTVAAPGTYGAYGSGFDPYGHFYTENYNMMWKQIVEGSTSFTAPSMDGDATPLLTFDWRLGAPYMLKALADRLLVIAALDPNFITDGYYDGELWNYYTAVTQLYNQMNNAVQCGSTDYLFYQSAVDNNVWPPTQTQVEACAVVCADIYTGFSVLSAITPQFPMTVASHYYNGELTTTNTSATCETVKGTSTYTDAVNKTAAVIRQEMPLFEMKSAIDNLYRMLNPYPSEDLTQIDNMITPMTGSDVCIGGLNDFGQVEPGNSLQLVGCDWTDPSQSWTYNRVTGQIINNSNSSLCIEMDGTTAGVPATIATCATPHPSANDPTGMSGAIEIDNVYQKFTYNGGTDTLINGSGLALGWQAFQNNWLQSPTPGLSVVSNVWNQGSGWADPSWDGSMAEGGTNMQWRSDSPAFTWPVDVGSPSTLASAPGVAANGDFTQQMDLFWVDNSNELRQAELNVWSGWTIDPGNPADLGPDPVSPGSPPPAATSWAPGRLDVVQLGNTRGGCQLYHLPYDNGGWYPWESVPAANEPVFDCAFSPAISSWGPGRLDIFAVDYETGGIDHAAFDSSLGGWQAWEQLGVPALYGYSGNASSTPAAVSWGPNRIDVIVRGADYNIYHNAYQDGYWYGWENLGGASTAGAFPTITAYVPNRLDIFAVNDSFHLSHLIWDNAWDPEGWSDMGLSVPTSVAAASTADAFMYVFSTDYNGALWTTVAE